MKNMIGVTLVGIGVGWAGLANADPLVWNTKSGSGVCSSGIGNSCTFVDDGHVLTARAYSTNNNSGSGDFEKATLTVWSGGLGVRNPDQSNEYSSPNHALDDRGRDDLIVFENNDVGNYFTGFKIGWYQNDSDVSAWAGTLAANFDFTGIGFSDLAGLGFTKVDFSNVGVNTMQSLGALAGNYLILTPRNDSNSDYVKVKQISARTPNKVSEPGLLALFGIAALGAVIGRRQNGSRRNS